MKSPRKHEQKTESRTWKPAIVARMVSMPKPTTKAVFVESVLSGIVGSCAT